MSVDPKCRWPPLATQFELDYRHFGSRLSAVDRIIWLSDIIAHTLEDDWKWKLSNWVTKHMETLSNSFEILKTFARKIVDTNTKTIPFHMIKTLKTKTKNYEFLIIIWLTFSFSYIFVGWVNSKWFLFSFICLTKSKTLIKFSNENNLWKNKKRVLLDIQLSKAFNLSYNKVIL